MACEMHRNRARARSGLGAALAAAMVVAGCVQVLPDTGPAPYLYRLEAQAKNPQTPAGGPAARAVLVARPEAADYLRSDRIYVAEPDGALAVLAGARWSDPTPEAVQSLMTRTLSNMGEPLLVARAGGGLAGDGELRLHIRRFELGRTDGVLEARVALDALMLDRASRKVCASHQVTAEARGEGRSAGEGVALLQEAAAQAALEIAESFAAEWPIDPSQPACIADESQAEDAANGGPRVDTAKEAGSGEPG